MSYQLLDQPTSPQRRTSRLPALLRSRPVSLGAFAITALLLLSLGHSPTRTKLRTWTAGADKGEEAYVRPTREELLKMVGPNPRFLTKDGWSCYGYNNQRYMLESTLILARIADRIPVIPDAIWSRACAVDSSICRDNALLFYERRNSHPEALKCQWNDDGEVYKLGIENFLDLPHLRRTYGPFLTISEFFDLYQLPSADYDQTQVWNATTYNPEGLTTSTVPADVFQNRTFVRVDGKIPSSDVDDENDGADGFTAAEVQKALGSRVTWTIPNAKEALRKAGAHVEALNEGELLSRLTALGAVPLYTFDDEVLMNKAVARPSIELSLPTSLQSFTSLLSSPSHSSSSILYLQGDLHDQRKPGGLYFTTPEARDGFTEMVLRGVRAPGRVREVGRRVAERMREKVGGRRWVAAHLRRGDFVDIAWSPSKDAVVHFNKTVAALSEGVKALEEHFDDRLPLPSDPFYLATDESSPAPLTHYTSHRALLLSTLLTPSDLLYLGPSSSYTDVLAVVEQQVLAQSDFFVGSELSSTSGGAINARLARGAEEWSWSLLKRG